MTAGLSSLLACPLPGATLWLGASRAHAFDERSGRQLARWAQLVEKLLSPSDDGAVYRRFIAMMAAPTMYLNGDTVFLNRAAETLTGYRADELATQRIRATQLSHVPIVALTAGVMDGDRERCLAAGMDEFLRKPVRLEELERALALPPHRRGRARGLRAYQRRLSTPEVEPPRRRAVGSSPRQSGVAT